MVFKYIFFVLIIFSCSLQNIYTEKSVSDEQILEILRTSFPYFTVNQITPLYGGSSFQKKYRISFKTSSQEYVLCLNDPKMIMKNKSELFAMLQASKIGVAPKVNTFSDDASVIIMDYIRGSPSTIECSKSQNLSKLANTLRKVHSLPKNPFQNTSIFERIYSQYLLLKSKKKTSSQLDNAFEWFKRQKNIIEKISVHKVFVHGDLHAGNILFTSDKAILIDWSENGFEHPFFDLSYLAICLGYNEQEEDTLLTQYLKIPVPLEEKARYYFFKKMNYFYFSISLYCYAYSQAECRRIILKKDDPILDWSFYIKYSENKQNLSPQFFYNFARCALAMFYIVNSDSSK